MKRIYLLAAVLLLGFCATSFAQNNYANNQKLTGATYYTQDDPCNVYCVYAELNNDNALGEAKFARTDPDYSDNAMILDIDYDAGTCSGTGSDWITTGLTEFLYDGPALCLNNADETPVVNYELYDYDWTTSTYGSKIGGGSLELRAEASANVTGTITPKVSLVAGGIEYVKLSDPYLPGEMYLCGAATFSSGIAGPDPLDQYTGYLGVRKNDGTTWTYAYVNTYLGGKTVGFRLTEGDFTDSDWIYESAYQPSGSSTLYVLYTETNFEDVNGTGQQVGGQINLLTFAIPDLHIQTGPGNN